MRFHAAPNSYHIQMCIVHKFDPVEIRCFLHALSPNTNVSSVTFGIGIFMTINVVFSVDH